jgi:hypothetical protein
MGDRARVARRSSHKGSHFERVIAKQLSRWWWGEPDVLVRAGAGSGSLATKRGIENRSVLLRGEFVQIDYVTDPFPYWPELTHRIDSLSLGGLLTHHRHPYWNKWRQALRSCKKIAAPMVIYLENRKAPVVSLPLLLVGEELRDRVSVLRPPQGQGLPTVAALPLLDFLACSKTAAAPAVEWCYA